MSLISFIKEAGEKLLGHGAAQAPAQAAPTPQDVAKLSETAGNAIADYVRSQGLKVDNLKVAFNASNGVVTVSGTAPDQATKEKVVLCCGNVANVTSVDDQLTVAGGGQTASQLYTVASGDTLSKIAKQFYGDANKYPQIFEANKPMLSSPDKIYPGQVLRIPPAA